LYIKMAQLKMAW